MMVTWILAGLLFKHFLCDFPLQTRYQFSNKGKYGHPGGLLHASLHAVGTMSVLLWALPVVAAVKWGLMDGFIHYHIDWLKNRLNKRLNLTPTGGAGFWILFGCDQLLHHMTYIGIVSLSLLE